MPQDPRTAPVQIFDNLLPPHDQQAVLAYLNRPGWAYGGYSDPGGDRYFYKHFAGLVQSGAEALVPSQIEDELVQTAPLIAQLWSGLKAGPLRGHMLARCYANGMPAGTEGSPHTDSDVADHFTAIYYPHLTWDASLGGETLVFNEARDEILAAIYPRPNRLAVFAGTSPHVARPVSKRFRDLRITLMFKLVPAAAD